MSLSSEAKQTQTVYLSLHSQTVDNTPPLLLEQIMQHIHLHS